jgi:hypothetical protein
LWWWVLLVRAIPLFFVGLPFLAWTVFGLPLYALSAIGLSSKSQGSRRIQFDLALTLALWAIVALFAVHVQPVAGEVQVVWDTQQGLPKDLFNYICGAWPFVVGARELARVALALRRSQPAAA